VAPRRHTQRRKREFSVLWAAFPLLDQFVDHRPLDAVITFSSLANQLDDADCRCDAEAGGSSMNGMAVSALIGLCALIIGLLIVHFTPEEPRTPVRRSCRR